MDIDPVELSKVLLDKFVSDANYNKLLKEHSELLEENKKLETLVLEQSIVICKLKLELANTRLSPKDQSDSDSDLDLDLNSRVPCGECNRIGDKCICSGTVMM